ncbi:hypothetical protein HFO33_34110 [Rhizobium leguminosarum]|uniref:hypothetical protein n=1 Tax=Rhizobium leguminosarum TaxID=384 RepID=UPI001C93BF98|nr:hypothetical protein [Rhizobium leguminosarum]MBY5721533.1 hypothetical protein [Rhizobium leguminosarum]
MNKIHTARISMIILSFAYFIVSYCLLRYSAYYDSIYEELSDLVRLHGPLVEMLLISPQVYFLVTLSGFLIYLRKRDGVVKQLMGVWFVVFVLGSAWTTLVIYLIENG